MTKQNKHIMLIKQTKEEIANTFTHLIGAVISASLALILIIKSSDLSPGSILGITIFCISAIAMYISSSIYHWALPGKTKRILRYFDHSNIYILIAASYSPVLLCSIKGALGWWMFGALWFIAIMGICYKIFFLGKYPKLSLAIYLMMGWSVVLIARPVWREVPAIALSFIALEGIFYTAGTYFYSHDSKQYYHAIWHVFVLGGTLSHFAAIWFII